MFVKPLPEGCLIRSGTGADVGWESILSISDTFKKFLENLAIDNSETISLRYGEITSALNKKFRDTDSKTTNCLQVGSYGRWTAIKGVSDLDMLYIMPFGKWDDYKNGGQYRLLKDTKDAISARYPNTVVKVDRLVVRVLYASFHIEVQPVFELEGGGFNYPDTYNGGSWKVTKPREEIKAMAEVNAKKNRNLRRLCKMARAWKNKHGVGMGGLLIDTLAHNFLNSTTDYDERSYLYYDWMSRDFFRYLADLQDQGYYAALGSGQRVKVKKKFQKKASKAYDLCVKAIEAEGTDSQNAKWKKVYGRPFPAQKAEEKKATLVEANYEARNTEEFFEDMFPIDIRYDVQVECEITQKGFRPYLLTDSLQRRLRLQRQRSLKFYVYDHNVEGEFTLYWKVLNRGTEAIKRDCIRGQINKDNGSLARQETADFYGDHVVECAAVQNGVIVATDRIHVPIE